MSTTSRTSGFDTIVIHDTHKIVHTALILNVVFLPLATAAIVLRMWSRMIMKQAFSVNDYLLVASWPLLVGLAVVSIVSKSLLDRPVSMGNLSEVYESSKAVFFCEIVWTVAITLAKLSILHLYTQVFPSRVLRRICLTGMAFVLTSMVVFLFMQIFQCRPLAKYWHWKLKGTCKDIQVLTLVISVVHVCTDLFIIALPMPFLVKLKVAWKQKLGIIVMFGFSAIIVAVGLIRIQRCTNLHEPSPIGQAKITILSILEPYLSVICASLPIILPALRRILGFPTRRPTPSRYTNSFLRIRDGNERSRRLDDTIPLTSTAVTASPRIDRAGGNALGSKFDEEESQRSESANGKDSQLIIEVRHDFSVVSTPGPPISPPPAASHVSIFCHEQLGGPLPN